MVCYQYGSNVFNPVTGNTGGAWECSPYEFGKRFIRKTWDGDVYGLQDGIPRTPLPKLGPLPDVPLQ